MYTNSLKQLIYEKTYLAVHYTEGCFCQFVDRKVVGLMLTYFKYYLLSGDASQVSVFSLHMTKMSKQHRFTITITKVLTILCLLCLCGNREYPGSFRNKSVSSYLKWATQVYSVPGQTGRRSKVWKWRSIDLFLTCGRGGG